MNTFVFTDFFGLDSDFVVTSKLLSCLLHSSFHFAKVSHNSLLRQDLLFLCGKDEEKNYHLCSFFACGWNMIFFLFPMFSLSHSTSVWLVFTLIDQTINIKINTVRTIVLLRLDLSLSELLLLTSQNINFGKYLFVLKTFIFVCNVLFVNCL